MSQPAIQEAIHLLFSGQDLTEAQADAAMSEIMLGEATPLRLAPSGPRCESRAKLSRKSGCAAPMRRSAVPVASNVGDTPLVDVVGTGGDGAEVQHQHDHGFRAGRRGMRGQTRQSLQSPRRQRRCARGARRGAAAHAGPGRRVHREIGIAFLSRLPITRPCVMPSAAPRDRRPHHLQHPRPLTNPALTTHQLIGVYAEELTGSWRTRSRTWQQGRLRRLRPLRNRRRSGRVDHHRHKPHNPPTQRRGHHARLLDPAELGFERTLADLQGGEAQTNALIARPSPVSWPDRSVTWCS